MKHLDDDHRMINLYYCYDIANNKMHQFQSVNIFSVPAFPLVQYTFMANNEGDPASELIFFLQKLLEANVFFYKRECFYE